VVIMAAREILLATADGAYLKLAGRNAEMGGPGVLAQKFSRHLWDGPASVATDLPRFKQGELARTPQLLRPTDGKPVEGAAFQARTGDGSLQEGKTGADGKTPKILADRLKTLALRFTRPPRK
jgi:type VI secretion system secreted protein VgrG